ncbi:MAG: GNAT family N-acetyltransferase [Pyrinomonadaceae bacterium]
MEIRPEEDRDRAAVYELNTLAFGGLEEADLVDRMRAIEPYFALVAELDGRVVGHIAFSGLTLNGETTRFLGLAPMAVLPELQNQTIGSILVTEGVEWMAREGFSAVFLIGHPHFYPRFGFEPAGQLGFTCEFPAPDDAFLVCELTDGCLAGRSGLIEYNSAFKEI